MTVDEAAPANLEVSSSVPKTNRRSPKEFQLCTSCPLDLSEKGDWVFHLNHDPVKRITIKLDHDPLVLLAAHIPKLLRSAPPPCPRVDHPRYRRTWHFDSSRSHQFW